jgi:hypothetical protein
MSRLQSPRHRPSGYGFVAKEMAARCWRFCDNPQRTIPERSPTLIALERFLCIFFLPITSRKRRLFFNKKL